ncbi:nitrite reductase small subunit NirD [Celeribacter halophilus]|jgi:nitrite reductase (NADH) small subunit|uniref:Nitrite reductase small subunit NirD n=1 Tax=Celeribacter halophilus TaxID=576117 RepID=A0AAW7XWC7_9RHOB|nr:nitrite reductase small subunit NirD [Celeribacter halophilus]MBU2890957.1 nitrite reductase small subunit NirD [Celeribacter halophilus]MDO6457996.1 nitrite reductase small subunit NirD [Celeribacter halophilus]MDO6511157.1 nitrite reductase small subunit NirD [Celeribacter halophilus]MDO6722491.1 nitrite reductase small subunit NirD [Celeribacter halophilus]
MSSTWIDIAALDDVPQRGARLVKTAHGCVAVFRTGTDDIYALDNACPHKSGPLADGIVHGASVTCPLHNWVISLETGMVQGPDEGQVATYPARVEDGRILLDAVFLRTRAVA